MILYKLELTRYDRQTVIVDFLKANGSFTTVERFGRKICSCQHLNFKFEFFTKTNKLLDKKTKSSSFKVVIMMVSDDYERKLGLETCFNLKNYTWFSLVLQKYESF